jgi:tryptophan 2,3-dioxygenase
MTELAACLPQSYAAYLRLNQLMTLQRPQTSKQDARTWAAEHFFIVFHQTSELWATQIFIDIAGAARCAEAGDWETASVFLTRASALVALVARNLSALRCMPVADFLSFRAALGDASGAESVQFSALLRCSRQPTVRSIRASLAAALAAAAPDGVHEARPCNHAVCATARALEALLEGVGKWRRTHSQIARHFIADLPGTGGTTGVRYLMRDAEIR